ncbi:MAG: nucleotidyl transferase AbiEii/AbiGii toxin family protein [Candidatus Aureabacteria bacterium]|nr:nucleotidyl transferase AbiEii/AbiGii toxin family protein [Candidatus Auribacterota bacterium]
MKIELKQLENIRKLAIIAMVSDDDLFQRLVLKGGNAIDFIYHAAGRSSLDVDFSMEKDFKKNEIEIFGGKIRKSIEKTYLENGYYPFDIKFTQRPKRKSEQQPNFWGGYLVEFKLLDKNEYESLKTNIEKQRREAIIIDKEGKRIFKIDISKYEFCSKKEKKQLNDYTVYVYTPTMLIFEKLRALCQQMPEYKKIIHCATSPRSKDFVDIYFLNQKYPINIKAKENKNLLLNIFKIKDVPLNFLEKIKNHKEFYRRDYDSVKDTVKTGIKLKSFDFYFNEVLEIIETLKIFWIK